MWKRQREGERKREKNRRRIGGEVGRAGKKKDSVSYSGMYVLQWNIKRELHVHSVYMYVAVKK